MCELVNIFDSIVITVDYCRFTVDSFALKHRHFADNEINICSLSADINAVLMQFYSCIIFACSMPSMRPFSQQRNLRMKIWKEKVHFNSFRKVFIIELCSLQFPGLAATTLLRITSLSLPENVKRPLLICSMEILSSAISFRPLLLCIFRNNINWM